MSDLISRQALCKYALNQKDKAVTPNDIMRFPSAEPKTEMVLCALADRTCPFQGKEFAWCLTCPHISEEDRNLVKKAVSEPKTGEWIETDEYGGFKCDQCGWDMVGTSRFCPNCGADMRGEKHE